jgi:hypothetical protein
MTSACVDCATPIIGTRARCPVCRQQHDDATRSRPQEADAGFLVRWMVVIEVFVIVVLGVIVGARACLP